jgi:hypothetical protein
MDTLDLQDLGAPIKVNFNHANGNYFNATIKSDVGNISASNFDVFIAPADRNNTIDRSKSTSTPPLTIDLDEGIYYESVKYGAFAKIENFTNAIGFDLLLTTGNSEQIVAKIFTSSSDIFNDVTYPEGSEFYMGNTKDTLGGVFVGM